MPDRIVHEADELKNNKAWRYQRSNYQPQIEGQTIQWPRLTNGRKEKQWSIKHYI